MNTQSRPRGEFDISLFINGDQGTFSLVYQMNYRRLCFVAQNIINDYLEAEDIVTEAMIKLWKSHQNFVSLSKICAFLYLTVKNAAINSLKAKKRHVISHEEIRLLSIEGDGSEENERIYAEIVNDIYCEIEYLPTKCRRIFKSIYLDGKTSSEIATEMDITTRTVLNQKARALAILRLALLKRTKQSFNGVPL